jgi:tRNA A37 threonylcarbamoyladenosine dehydratase
VGDTRTDRIERLVGSRGIQTLADACVMVIGIGGVGSNCTVALARAQVGTLVIVDSDVVQKSNINRQAIAFESTIGRPKVDVMRDLILDINPLATVHALQERVLPADVGELMERFKVDFCIDAQDTVVTKLALAAYCDDHDISLLSSMGAANKFDPTQLEFADISETRVCPLCRSVRKLARTAGIEHMRVLYTPEQPADVEAQQGSTRGDRSDLGTMSYMPAIMGQMLAARALCDLLGIEWT